MSVTTSRASTAGPLTAAPTPAHSPAATRVLDVAERLVAQRGFNAVSYADIATELGMTKPALHYHFAGKAELGTALVVRYHDRFVRSLADIDAEETSRRAKLDRYAGLYLDVLLDQRMCLCGILAAEYETLPSPMREAVLDFFAANESWLCSTLQEGSDTDQLQLALTPRDTARMIISCLEGALLIARPYADADRFRTTAAGLLTAITTTTG